MNRFLRLTLLSLSCIALVSCGGTSSTSGTGGTSGTSENGNTSSNPTLTNAFLSPAKLSYTNMRPTYNYYMTTFAFENLETFSDNTYCLSLSSSTFSAVILPEEGNDATGNERNNSLVKYYGSFTSTVDDLDDDTVYYHLSEPSRIVGSDDTLFFYDTANWTDAMKEKTADVTYEYDAETGAQKATGKKEYATGAEFLAAKKFKAVKFTTAKKTRTLEYVDLFAADREADASAPASVKTKVDTAIHNGFLSPAKLSYSNMRPTYNYYLTTFAFQNLELIGEKEYCFTVSSSTFSAVILPEEGNDATGNERNNSLVKYYGSFTSTVDDLDEDTVYYNLSEPTRIVGSDDTLFFYDTANWTDAMKEKTADVTYEYDAETGTQKATGKKEYATGAEFLAAKKFAAIKVTSAQKTHSLEFAPLVFNK